MHAEDGCQESGEHARAPRDTATLRHTKKTTCPVCLQSTFDSYSSEIAMRAPRSVEHRK